MEISAKDVMKLRQMSGAGMMDCKKALSESAGDLDAALDYLRKKGLKTAEKRADREANEGKVVFVTTPDARAGVLLELVVLMKRHKLGGNPNLKSIHEVESASTCDVMAPAALLAPQVPFVEAEIILLPGTGGRVADPGQVLT